MIRPFTIMDNMTKVLIALGVVGVVVIAAVILIPMFHDDTPHPQTRVYLKMESFEPWTHEYSYEVRVSNVNEDAGTIVYVIHNDRSIIGKFTVKDAHTHNYTFLVQHPDNIPMVKEDIASFMK